MNRKKRRQRKNLPGSLSLIDVNHVDWILRFYLHPTSVRYTATISYEEGHDIKFDITPNAVLPDEWTYD